MPVPRFMVALAAVTIVAACGRPAGPSLIDPATGEPSPTTSTVAPLAAAGPSPWPALDRSGEARVVITPTGVVAPVRGRQGSGWRVTTPCDKEAVVTNAKPVAAAHVVIDAGHGGTEVGATAQNGVRESDLNLDIARQVKSALEARGMTVLLTREGDYRLPVATRAEIVNAVQPSLFLSIHHNGGEAATRTTPGTEVYYQQTSTESKRLAGLVWEDIVDALAAYQISWRGSDDAGAIYRRDRDGNDFYGVLRLTAGVPAALIEAAYLSSKEEADLLKRADVRAREAAAIAQAITRYFTTADPGGGFQTPLFRGYESGGGGTLVNCTDPKLQ